MGQYQLLQHSMGGQITTIPQDTHRQSLQQQNKRAEGGNQIRVEPMGEKVQFEVARRYDLINRLMDYRDEQNNYRCNERNHLISRVIDDIIDKYDLYSNRPAYSHDQLQIIFNQYYQKDMLPEVKMHEQDCFACSGRHWELRQWNIPEQRAAVEEAPHYKRISFTITNPQDPTAHLKVIIYKYLKTGDGYLKSDKVRNMKIFKKPLSELQLTNLILNHQYLVVQCENSYWSFEKDTKRLIIQASVLLSDVRDRILGEKRIAEMKFTWLGLRDKWFPQVMYESNDIIVSDISEVRVFGEHTSQTSLKYNVFKANCKIYAQYIMKRSISEHSWQKNKTFFDFFHQ